MTAPAQTAFSELYAAYAAGCLDPAFALMVETQGELKPGIRDGLAAGEMISGALLEGASASRLSDGALDRALAAIEELDAGPVVSAGAARAAGEAMTELLALPEPLRGHALEAAGGAGWQMLGRGIRRLKLNASPAMEAELYRISPGARIPRHTHAGGEYTLVVSGGFTDERGSYGPGDVCFNGPEDTHQPVGDAGEICYALAIRDGGLRFTGVFGLLQRLLRA